MGGACLAGTVLAMRARGRGKGAVPLAAVVENPLRSQQQRPVEGEEGEEEEEEEELPSGWRLVEDDEGRRWYEGPNGASSWTAPLHSQQQQQSQERRAGELPLGWRKVQDEDGAVFYEGPGGQTSWDPPGLRG